MGAWQRDSWTSMIRVEGYASDIFTIIAGTDEQSFRAHAAVLAQSPVFEVICYGNYKEKQEQSITLPDDDPAVIGAIIQYLYSGNFLRFGTTDEEEASDSNSAKVADQLADIYLAAEKYQLEDLKTLVIQKLEPVTDVEQCPTEFLTIGQKIYANVAEAENVYRAFFEASASLLPSPGRMKGRLLETFNECLSQGGFLAIDLNAALNTRYDERLQEKQKNVWRQEKVIAGLKDDCTMAQWKTDGLLIEIADLERKVEDFTNRYEVAAQQKMGLISRLRTLEQNRGTMMARRDQEHDDFQIDG
ncbi:MAG: hypothetical protein Q9184_005386 [Pyrenodesmia sp. 2 TL-2023]